MKYQRVEWGNPYEVTWEVQEFTVLDEAAIKDIEDGTEAPDKKTGVSDDSASISNQVESNSQ